MIFVLQSSDGNEGTTDMFNYIFLVFPTFGFVDKFRIKFVVVFNLFYFIDFLLHSVISILTRT